MLSEFSLEHYNAKPPAVKGFICLVAFMRALCPWFARRPTGGGASILVKTGVAIKPCSPDIVYGCEALAPLEIAMAQVFTPYSAEDFVSAEVRNFLDAEIREKKKTEAIQEEKEILINETLFEVRVAK